MIFDFTDNYQFSTRLLLNGENIEILNSTKLLGTIISEDLKWDLNTENIVKKANSRMELLRKVASFSPSQEDDLKDVYFLFIRSLLEQSATVWHSSLTKENSDDLERVQKCAVRIILGQEYNGYEKALIRLDMESLKNRRETLCLNFALKCLKNKQTKNIFPENIKSHQMKTRTSERFMVQHANTERLRNSSVIYMQKLLNQNEQNSQV